MTNIERLVRSSPQVYVGFAVAVARMVVDQLREDDELGHRLALEALSLADDWLAGQPVSGDDLAAYVDGPDEEKDLGLREGLYGDDQEMISALVVITIALGLAAAAAYDDEESRLRPTPVWETTPEMLVELVQFATASGSCSDPQLGDLARQFLDAAGPGGDRRPT